MSLARGPHALHGALARRSPFTTKPRYCVVCTAFIDSTVLMNGADPPSRTICHACWLDGWRPYLETGTSGGDA
jgi:hypothetical protein